MVERLKMNRGGVKRGRIEPALYGISRHGDGVRWSFPHVLSGNPGCPRSRHFSGDKCGEYYSRPEFYSYGMSS
jgi:hypothetical protein